MQATNMRKKACSWLFEVDHSTGYTIGESEAYAVQVPACCEVSKREACAGNPVAKSRFLRSLR